MPFEAQAPRQTPALPTAPAGARLMPIVHRSFAKGHRVHAVLAAGFVALASCRSGSPLPTTTQPAPSQSRPQRPANQLPALWGFTAPWDARSDSSVRATTSKLDAVVTGWIQLDSATSLPSLRYADDSTRNRGGAQRLTLVTSWHGERFHPETIRRLGKDAAALALAASRVGALVAAGEYRGIVLDLEDQSPADLPLTVRVASAIADSAKAHGATFAAIALPAADTAGYPTRAFIPALDLVVIMLYDEHWSTSARAPSRHRSGCVARCRNGWPTSGPVVLSPRCQCMAISGAQISPDNP